MTDPPRASAPASARPPSATVARVFSLSGIVPLGAFLVVHVATNACALRGPAAFARAVGAFRRVPALPLVEALVVFVPLLLHAAIGTWLVVARRPLSPASPYPAALRVTVRATGTLAVAFVTMHLLEVRFRGSGAPLGAGELATVLSEDLSATQWGVPWRGVAYLFGTACVAFHFAAGLWGSFARSRRGRASVVARTWAAWGAAAVGAAMWIAFADVVVFHATGARLLGAPGDQAAIVEPCPTP